MLAALSPAGRNFYETLNTLQYAERAKKIVTKVQLTCTITRTIRLTNTLPSILTLIRAKVHANIDIEKEKRSSFFNQGSAVSSGDLPADGAYMPAACTGYGCSLHHLRLQPASPMVAGEQQRSGRRSLRAVGCPVGPGGGGYGTVPSPVGPRLTGTCMYVHACTHRTVGAGIAGDAGGAAEPLRISAYAHVHMQATQEELQSLRVERRESVAQLSAAQMAQV